MTPYSGALGWVDLAVSALLIVLAGAVSLAWGLGIHRRLLVSAVRSVVQLLLLALVLQWLFAHTSPWLTALAAAVMLGFAANEIFGRQDRRLTGAWGYGAGGLAITLAATAVTLFALAGPVRPEPWYDPRYAIPLLGMILGNVMTGIAVGSTPSPPPSPATGWPSRPDWRSATRAGGHWGTRCATPCAPASSASSTACRRPASSSSPA